MFLFVEPSAPMARGIPNPYALDAIAERLILLRHALDNTQETMGRLAGVNPKAWQNYEKARRRIDLDNAIQLEIATGAPQEWVYGGFGARLPSELALKIEVARRKLAAEAKKAKKS